MYKKPAKGRTPETHIPDDAELVRLVAEHPGLSLRQLAGLAWPDLAWRAASTGADSATGRTREWQEPPRPGTTGNRTTKATAAIWLRDRLAELVTRGELHHAPRQRDEVDLLAGLAYVAPDAAPVPAGDPLPALATARR